MSRPPVPYRPTRSRMVARRSAVRDAAKRLLAPVLDGFGVLDWRVRQLLSSSEQAWLIAMYHRIVPDDFDARFDFGMCVRQSHFVEQLSYLRSLGDVLPMTEVVDRRLRGAPLPRRIISITFDDGYLDNLDIAAPLLARSRLPWTLFVTTGGLESGVALWWDRVIESVRAWRGDSIDLRGLGLGQLGTVYPLTEASRADVAVDIISAAWTLPKRHVDDVVAALEEGAGPSAQPGPRRMSTDQIASLHARGVEIGAHTCSHIDLTRQSAAQVQRELQDSRRLLSEVCGAPIRGFAFPAGRHSPSTLDAVRSAGFDYSVLTTVRVNGPQDSLHTLGRIGMPDTRVLDFKRALAFLQLRTQGNAPMAAGADG